MFLGRLEVRLESQAATRAKRRPRSQTVEPHSLPSLLLATVISRWAEQRKKEFASVSPALASLSGGSRRSQPEGRPWYSLHGSSSGGPGVCGRVLAPGLPGEGSLPLPGHPGSWPTAHARKCHQNGEERPQADHTLHKTDPPLPQAQSRRQTPGPGLRRALCVPDWPTQRPHFHPTPMPSTSAEGHRVLTGGASWGLGIGLGTRWEGPSRQCGTVLGTTLSLTPGNRSHPPSVSALLLANEPCCFFPFLS